MEATVRHDELERPGTAADRPAGPRPGTSSIRPYSLHLAVAEGSVSTVRRLLRDAADPDEREMREGWTALHIACGLGHGEIVGMLLDGNADANARDSAGWTPLHSACRFGHADVAQMLLEARAHPALPSNNSHKTPLDYARQFGSLDCAMVLRPYLEAMPPEALVSLPCDQPSDNEPPPVDDDGVDEAREATWSASTASTSSMRTVEEEAEVADDDKVGYTPYSLARRSQGRRSRGVVPA